MIYRNTSVIICVLLAAACTKPTVNETGSADNSPSTTTTAPQSSEVDQQAAPSSNNQAYNQLAIVRSWSGNDPEQPSPSANPVSDITFTPEGFRQFAQRRTKAYTRAMFGPPSEVDEANDEWVYFAGNEHLKILDEDAGKQVFARLRFSTSEDGQERVDNVELF